MNANPSHWNRAIRHLELGEHHLAAQSAAEGIRSFPNAGSLWQVRGIARYYLQEYLGSIRDFETSLCLCVMNPGSLWCMSAGYVELGLNNSARDSLISLLRHRRLPSSLLYPTAGLLGRIGDDELALQSCEELSRKEPNSPAGYYGQALYMSRIGYPMPAIQSRLQEAYRLSPESIEYRVALGATLASMGESEKSLSVLSSLRLDSVLSSHVASRIARAITDAGDRERASLWWARSLRLSSMMI